MGILSFWRNWKRGRAYRRPMLLQQLEERIVLDAAVSSTQDNPENQADSHEEAGKPVVNDPTAAAAPQAPAADGNAGLVAPAPQTFEQVFTQDLKVLLVSNALADAANAKICTLSVFEHGGEGVLQLGSDHITFFNVNDYGSLFQELSDNLTAGAQIQLYGCNVAESVFGQALVDRIVTYTHSDVFASKDATGGDTLDWDLEYASNASSRRAPEPLGPFIGDMPPLPVPLSRGFPQSLPHEIRKPRD